MIAGRRPIVSFDFSPQDDPTRGMGYTYFIMDALADAVDASGAGPSVLTLPLGRWTFLAQLTRRAQRFAGGDPGPLLVMPTFPTDGVYPGQLAASAPADVRVVREGELSEVLAGVSAGDSVVVYDAAKWPAELIDPEPVLRAYARDRAPLFVVGTGVPTGRAQELVQTDAAGQVTRVRRAYGRGTASDPAAPGAFLAIIPVEHLRDVRFESIVGLRAALADRGIAARETTVPVDVHDLRTVDGMLAMTARWVARQPAGDVSPENAVEIADTCRVDATARLIGPIVLHDDVEIGPGATVVGPAVIGKGARVGANAMLAQVVLAPQTQVAEGVTLRHCVATGHCATSYSGAQVRPVVARVHRVVGPPGPRWNRRVQLALKRTLDVVLSAVGIVILSPLLLGVAILIKLTSRGSVFFIHRRERADGKEFGCVKFRTMTEGAHLLQEQLLAQNEVDGPQFKLSQDPRVTRLGAWLRTTNVDELPQIFNVLAGHMSLVGPRPSPFQENQICVPWRRARLSVRPGITGLWQICRSADRSAGDFHEWIYYDMAYVRSFSLWLDVKILLATLLTLGGRNSLPITRLIPTTSRSSAAAPQSLVT